MSVGISFKPVSHHSARVLILGSMPGVKSLSANEYYAHPRNSFWQIMSASIGFEPAISYKAKLDVLTQSGIALWDVLHSCTRLGSLDSGIEKGTRIANDFNAFLIAHPNIELGCFNGAEAEKSYNEYVLPKLAENKVRYVRLPSTSPTHAALSFDEKLQAWTTVIDSDM